MRNAVLTSVIIVSLFIFKLHAQTYDEKFFVGNTVKINSQILQEEREIFISLPEGYDADNASYPVLYLLDAEWYFHQTTAIVKSLIDGGQILPIIVVGIPNTNRNRDFNHEPDSSLSDYKTCADRFVKFFEKELFPYIESHYKTNSYRILKGWCLTGFFTLHTMLSKPELFNAYYAATPYVIEDDDYLFKALNKIPENYFTSQIYLSISTGGNDRPDLKEKIPLFVEKLKNQKFENLNISFNEFPDDNHYSVEIPSLYKSLKQNFSDFTNPEIFFEKGISHCVDTLKIIAQKFGYKECFPNSFLKNMDNILRNRELTKESNILHILSENFDYKLWEKAKKVHSDALVIDAHAHPQYFGKGTRDDFDHAINDETSQVDIPTLTKGGLDSYFMVLPMKRKKNTRNSDNYPLIIEDIQLVKNYFEQHSQNASVAFTNDHIKNIHQNNDKAILLSIECFNYLTGEISRLKNYYDNGIRMITLMHYGKDLLADTDSVDPGDHGISEYGKKVINEMNKLGIIIDITHCTNQIQNDIIEFSTVPVIASHSNTRSIIDIERNIPDSLLKKIADKGGLTAVTFYSGYVSNTFREQLREAEPLAEKERNVLENIYSDSLEIERRIQFYRNQIKPEQADISELIDHIDHIIKVAGIDHVGIGSDFGGTRIPEGLEDASGYPLITYHLLKRGYSEDDIHKILGKNLLRVIKDIEKSP